MRPFRARAILFALTIAPAAFAQAPSENDHTLQAMRDEMARAKSRLELKIPPANQPVRPYFIEYRLLDMDVREVTAEFGALMSSTHNRSRVMNVEARVGDYKLDSSNFISDEGFRGFIGPTGTVGIDRDYKSLRQDLWRRWKPIPASRPTSATSRGSRILTISPVCRSSSTSSRWPIPIGPAGIGSRKRGRPPHLCVHSRRFTIPRSCTTSFI
jgi:hypothetical protein